jgi:hypothetical protein
VNLKVVKANDGKHDSHYSKNPFLSSAITGVNKIHTAHFATTQQALPSAWPIHCEAFDRQNKETTRTCKTAAGVTCRQVLIRY